MAVKGRSGLEYDFSAIIESLGMEKLIQSIGKRRVMETVGPDIVKEMGVEWLLAKMRPEDLKRLKERLKLPLQGQLLPRR